MKKTIIGMVMTAVAVVLIGCSGCKSLPDVEQITKLGGTAGYTAAYVLNKQVNVTNAVTRDVIREVVQKIDKYLPATNETCSAKWTPMVKELTDSYVKDGKLTQAQADRVVKDFGTISTMLDNYIDKKGIRQYQELVDAFVHAFSDKFLTYFKPINVVSTSVENSSEECDQEMFEFLTTNIK